MYIERYKKRKRNKVLKQFDNLDLNGKIILYYKINNEAKQLSKQYEMVKEMYMYLPPTKPSVAEYISNAGVASGCAFFYSFLWSALVNPKEVVIPETIQIFALAECVVCGGLMISYLINKKAYKDKVACKDNKLYKTLSNIQLLKDELDKKLDEEKNK